MKCPNKQCGSTDIDWQEAGGDAVCVRCGTVCEESTIVSTIEFSEGSGGSSSVVGQFVSASCTKPYGGLGAPRSYGGGRQRYGFLRSSRETTLASGKRKIQQVASSLRLGSHYVDGAHRLFGMAAQRNFTQGRKTMHVVCACLYVMCRREKSAHMLCDFSDVLQTSVYALGSTFLKFRTLLNLELPIIDPSLYIHRFAAKLELGDKTSAVANTALRVVQRMRRDWIETGRRPAGVCAAALLVGSRAHGFHRTQDDVVRALRVCGMTVSQRLADFQRTPAAQLSLGEFTHPDSEKLLSNAEEHPPSYARAERERKQRDEDEEAFGDDDGGLLLDAEEEEALAPWEPLAIIEDGTSKALAKPPAVKSHRRAKRARERAVEKGKLYDEIREMLETEESEAPAVSAVSVTARRQRLLTAAPEPVKKKVKTAAELEIIDEDEEEDDDDDAKAEVFEDVADAEIDGFILSDEEMRKKSAIWNEMNKDYLVQKDERDRLAAARSEAAGEDASTKKKKTSKKKGKKGQASTARAALLDVVERRKFSKKINYAALEGIFGEEREEVVSRSRTAAPPPEDMMEEDEEEEEEVVEAPKRRARTLVGGIATAKRAAPLPPKPVDKTPAGEKEPVDDYAEEEEEEEEQLPEADYGDYDDEEYC